MNTAKPLASLSSGLLARKGAARPAMRPQLVLTADEADCSPAVSPDDLGWNDMGVAVEVDKPAILQQLEALAAAVADMPAPVATRRATGGKPVRSALAEGRKAAFTLRLDSYRHLRLRLACALEDRSAQGLLIEALDRFLADLPGIEDLAKRAVRN